MTQPEYYEKIPVPIKALQFNLDNYPAMCIFIDDGSLIRCMYLDDTTKKELPPGEYSNTIGMQLMTLNGPVLVTEGEYIIKGVNNEFYPCAEDIFEKTYKKVYNFKI